MGCRRGAHIGAETPSAGGGNATHRETFSASDVLGEFDIRAFPSRKVTQQNQLPTALAIQIMSTSGINWRHT